MIKSILLKLWKDPVWSKVIATVILALISVIYSLSITKYQGISFALAFYVFWNYKVSLWIYIVLLLFLGLLFYYTNRNFQYGNERIALDRKLFEEIRNKDGMLNLMLDIKAHGFSGTPVRSDRILTLIDILYESQNPDYEFINPKLNKLKIKLIKEFEIFDSILNKYIFSTYNIDWVSIPSEWEYDQPERMRKAKQEIKIQEDILTKLIKTLYLKVDYY